MTGRMTPKRRALLADALQEVQALRAEWQSSIEHHRLRLEARFKELERRLRTRPKGRQPVGLPSAKDAEALHELLVNVRVKAKKGRARDLRRVEDAVHEALDLLPGE